MHNTNARQELIYQGSNHCITLQNRLSQVNTVQITPYTPKPHIPNTTAENTPPF